VTAPAPPPNPPPPRRRTLLVSLARIIKTSPSRWRSARATGVCFSRTGSTS
jgi:hypothetical protein